MSGPEEAELFTAPPAEAYGIVDRVVGELDRCLENADRARAVVVDAGSIEHGVRVRTDGNHSVVVSAQSLRNNIETGIALVDGKAVVHLHGKTAYVVRL